MEPGVLPWLRDDLTRADAHAPACLTADLHRCARELGWALIGGLHDDPLTGVRDQTLRPAAGGAAVKLHAHTDWPLLAFTDATHPGPTFAPYLNPPGLTAWWQARGWLVPDAAWLNGTPDRADWDLLPPPTARSAKGLGFTRGDLLFRYW
ncbi:hypothetical protein [Deinococcus knuensis]|uniref:Uncharacterized protein n=1 Tax=Deinococcus knuensis TaxID=1837380 RepID=A0ABQ2SE50_9DEIO|nr:hypothetical protein [Deinococcus knuensis]GGS24477.1 hypothetical protein GCM10008961_15090 [Deinococcus knuensis]